MVLRMVRNGLAMMHNKTLEVQTMLIEDTDWRNVGEWVLVIVASIAVAAVIAKIVIKIRLRYLSGSSDSNHIHGYALGDTLGKGGFGEVKRAVNVFGNLIAVKKHHGEGWGRSRKEVATMKRIARGEDDPPEGFAKLLWFEAGMVGMTLLGPSLEHVRRVMPEKKFSLKTTLLIADQTLERIRYLHMKRTVHRDVKPENFVLGIGDTRNTVHLVDFGLSERFFDATTRSHIPYREGCTVYGTPYFTSVNADNGCCQSRRDDLESFGYMLVYLATGTLPWVGLKSLGPLNSWHQRVSNCKAKTPIATLCAGLPTEFSKILTYSRSLKYDDAPDYEYLRGMIHRRYAKLGYQVDNVYDWTIHGASWECWKKGGPPGEVDIDIET
eukprot:TRINITY_DN33772_c0_g1_i1.p1 TRINITY_DN33772_c0_g1~~TRINITY_DN33772_c0_g1_i1.p1  ORF type:complete len:402 (+),score=62.61 TRINITY_DN33772_c0_g1_i1:63-1208(+)